MFGRNFGLDAAPARSVARDHDCAFDGNAHAVEFVVVFAIAIVHVDERGGDVSVGGVGVVGGELFGGLVRCGVDRQNWFLQFGAELRGGDQFQDALFRRGKQYVEGFDLGVESPFFEAGEDPFGVVFVVGRADVVRSGAEAAHVFANVGGEDAVLKFLFPVAFGGGSLGGVAEELRGRGVWRGSRLCDREIGEGEEKDVRGQRAERGQWVLPGIVDAISESDWEFYHREGSLVCSWRLALEPENREVPAKFFEIAIRRYQGGLMDGGERGCQAVYVGDMVKGSEFGGFQGLGCVDRHDLDWQLREIIQSVTSSLLSMTQPGEIEDLAEVHDRGHQGCIQAIGFLNQLVYAASVRAVVH